MPNFRRLFDRFNRYRIAALFLAFPTAYVLVADTDFIDSPRELGVRVVYRIGLVILLIAIAMDTWTVYTGKRKVKKMIRERSKILKGNGKVDQ